MNDTPPEHENTLILTEERLRAVVADVIAEQLRHLDDRVTAIEEVMPSLMTVQSAETVFESRFVEIATSIKSIMDDVAKETRATLDAQNEKVSERLTHAGQTVQTVADTLRSVLTASESQGQRVEAVSRRVEKLDERQHTHDSIVDDVEKRMLLISQTVHGDGVMPSLPVRMAALETLYRSLEDNQSQMKSALGRWEARFQLARAVVMSRRGRVMVVSGVSFFVMSNVEGFVRFVQGMLGG